MPMPVVKIGTRFEYLGKTCVVIGFTRNQVLFKTGNVKSGVESSVFLHVVKIL